MAENIHKGHRERIRKKFIKMGIDTFSEHEMLEFMLFYCMPQRDTYYIAYNLLQKFGSLKGVLSASMEDIVQVDGIGKNSALFLSLMGGIFKECSSKEPPKKSLRSTELIGEYLKRQFESFEKEKAFLLVLNEQFYPLKTITLADGALDKANIDVSRVVKDVILLGGHYCVLAHNHPSNIALPSVSDIMTTTTLKTTLKSASIELYDHLIFSNDDFVSMRDSGANIFACEV